MTAAPVQHYVVILDSERVAPEARQVKRDETKARFGDLADAFARDIAAQIDHGDLPGVIAIEGAKSRSLPMVFVTATADGAEMLGRDARIKAISPG